MHIETLDPLVGWSVGARLSLQRSHPQAVRGMHMIIEASEISAELNPTVAHAPPAAVSEHPALRRRVLGLAGPVIGENLLETMLGIVDTALVARLGANATAGVGSAQQLMWFLICVLSA